VIKKVLKQIDHPILKWILSGGVAFVVDFSTLLLLVEIFNIYYLYATCIAFLLSATTNFLISRYLIFNATTNTVANSYVKFISISLLGLTVIASLMYILVDLVGLHYLLSRLLIASTVGVSSFYIHKLFTFNFKFGEKISK
jgi:putative flippase GtrA